MSHVTTHILNTATGKPAAFVKVILFQLEHPEWVEISSGITDHHGRTADLCAGQILMSPGTYKLRFLTKEYFEKLSTETFYPFIEIIFSMKTQEHYHIPLLLNSFGYTTYRGS